MKKIEKIKKEFGIKKGQKPLTKFIDHHLNVKVDILDWPDPERLKEVFVNFSTASWYENFFEEATDEEIQEAIDDLLSGNMLAQGIEHPRFAFRISGLTLHGSHAFVRNRIGIAYLQQSQAVQDFRHSDIIIPSSYSKKPERISEYIHWCIEGKMIYGDLLDSGEISITDARFSLPKTIPVWIDTTMNLATLLGIYKKRTDYIEEHPEMELVAEQMKDHVVDKFPYMEGYFRKGADTGESLHTKPGYKCNCLFKRPDHVIEKHLPEGYEDPWTLHDKTRNELMIEGNKPIDPTYWFGHEQISKEDYERRMELIYGDI